MPGEPLKVRRTGIAGELETYLHTWPAKLEANTPQEYLDLVSVRRRLTLGPARFVEAGAPDELLSVLESRDELFTDQPQQAWEKSVVSPHEAIARLSGAWSSATGHSRLVELDTFVEQHHDVRPDCLERFQAILFPGLVDPSEHMARTKLGPLFEQLEDHDRPAAEFLFGVLRAAVSGQPYIAGPEQAQLLTAVRSISIDRYGLPLLSQAADGTVTFDLTPAAS